MNHFLKTPPENGSHKYRRIFPVCLAALLSAFNTAGAEREAPFSLVVGTQALNATYQLTDQPALLEMANAIKEMGSDTLKISVSPKYPTNYRIEPITNAATTASRIRRNTARRR